MGSLNGASGIEVNASFNRLNGRICLEISLANKSNETITDFEIQIKRNFFSLTLEKVNISPLSPNTNIDKVITLNNFGATDSNSPQTPLFFDFAFKCSLDVFFFKVPCMFHTLLVKAI